jgi:hypothetical protein
MERAFESLFAEAIPGGFLKI